jgi:hypothetical protein
MEIIDVLALKLLGGGFTVTAGGIHQPAVVGELLHVACGRHAAE